MPGSPAPALAEQQPAQGSRPRGLSFPRIGDDVRFGLVWGVAPHFPSTKSVIKIPKPPIQADSGEPGANMDCIKDMLDEVNKLDFTQIYQEVKYGLINCLIWEMV